MADLHDNDPQTHKRTSINELLNPVAAQPVQPVDVPGPNNGTRLLYTVESIILDHIVFSVQFLFAYASAFVQSACGQLGSQWLAAQRR